MHQFVQSAIDAANQGDNEKAIAFLKRVLNADPNDVDAWMVLAAVVDDPQHKRQCLKRVLAINPTHQLAREELMEMDRAEMESELPSISEPAAYSTEYSSGTSDLYEKDSSSTSTETLPTPSSKTSYNNTKNKTLIFKYPLIARILMYALVIIPSCFGLFVATKNIFGGLIFLVPGFIMLIVVLVSPTVEINSSGVRVSTALSTSEIRWENIGSVKSNNKLQLIQNKGKIISIPKQVDGYSQIIEIVRERRPDLFGATISSQPDGSETYRGNVNSSPAFKGKKKFQKSFFKQFGTYFYFIPACLFATWLTLSEPQFRISGLLSILVCLVFLVAPLFQVSAVNVDSNKLTVETIFGEKSFNADDIREIKLQSVRGRYGQVKNFVNITLHTGGNHPLQGFSDGDEIIYGFLTNWWNSYL